MASNSATENSHKKNSEATPVAVYARKESGSHEQKVKSKPNAVCVQPSTPTTEQSIAQSTSSGQRSIKAEPVHVQQERYTKIKKQTRAKIPTQKGRAPAKTEKSGVETRQQTKGKAKLESELQKLPKAPLRDAKQPKAKPKASGKPEQPRAKPSSIRITFNERKEQSEIQQFLCQSLAIDHIEMQSFESDAVSGCSAIISLPSLTKAKKALEALQRRKKEYMYQYRVKLLSINIGALSNVTSQVESLQEYMLAKRCTYLEVHDKLIENLRSRLASLQSKKTSRPLEEYERVSKEREVLHSKLQERQEQRREFDDYTKSQLEELSALLPFKVDSEESLQNRIQGIKTNFSRECTRFSAALPIYAKRSEIIETIFSHQVTVLVGETGSGKSTQVVQYLYDAGLAESRLIVCTQPRKVAAITLAKHVCRELEIKLGEELGYRVGLGVKCSRFTSVLYMTDHALLNECILDRTLSKYSCVLIDEAHERSINTDMLLAFIKQCLSFRTDLKVVIMSATIEPKLFVRYFQEEASSEQCQSCPRVSTISVSGRTFPVDIEYNPLQIREPLTPESKYVENAVEMAKRIHSNKPPGDILVFLTCAQEIERACREIQHLSKKAIILPLHGKLPPEEQQKVFDEYSNKRKIIFSTNVAETSVTIPGIKYIVDTGLAKEMQFNSRKNMDSLEVRLISKSSAEQRKGRAGRISSGKCYRLYTADEYDYMAERTNPEILRIQLSQVVLKLFEFGVPDVLTFDFVEHPDRPALEAAVETLKFVGALQDNVLTDVGKKMATLPLNPQLAKVLLDGVKSGVGTEALCAVAISSLAGQVFFRGGTDEMKQESDKMKLMFCHEMGDQMTNLSVYYNWKQQEKKIQNQWCVENYVNAKSMRMVEETVKELRHILVQRLHIKLSSNQDLLEAAVFCLGKLYFDAFLNNLAVYLGHEQVGYMTMAENTFVIFPGSSLKQLGSTPKYVIYEKTLKTTQQFLIQVMDVKQEWVDEAIRSGRLPEDPAEKFKPHIFTPVDVIAVGPQTYNETKRNQKKILENVEIGFPQCTVSPVMDFTLTPKQWGVVRVRAPEKYHNAVKLVITQCVLEQQEKFKGEKKEFGILKEHDSTRLVIGAGGTVQRVVMPYQFRSLVAVSPNDGKWVKEIEHQIRRYGKIEKVQFKQYDKDFRLFITFNDPAAAQRAISEYQYPDVTLRPRHSQQFTVKVQWERRERGNFAFLSFDSPQHCESASHRLLCGLVDGGNKISINPDKEGRKDKLFLIGYNLHQTSEDRLRTLIATRIGENLPFHLRMGYMKYDPKVERKYLHKRNYAHRPVLYYEYLEEESLSSDEESLQEEGAVDREDIRKRYHEALRDDLMTIINRYAKPGTYLVKFPEPSPFATFFHTYITFDDPEEGYRVLNSELKLERMDGKPLAITSNLKCELVFRKEIFVLIRERLEQTQKDLLQRYYKELRIRIYAPNKENEDLARISIYSDDVRAFSIAQNELNSAAQPHIIECKTTELQEYILSHTCPVQLEEIQTSTSTRIYMCRDLSVMGIKIYGTKENQENADTIVKERARELFSGGAKVVEVELGGSGQPPGLMKCLVSRYGSNLEGMLGTNGIRRISLNPRQQQISVLATTEGVDALKKCIEEEYTKKMSQATVKKLESGYEVDCSACLTTVEEPQELLRLECCGHAFHTACIAMQVKSDTLTFPVQCASEGCSKEFVLKDFDNLQKRLKFRLKELVSASLKNHMKKNGDTYKNCPTPNCRMIYIKTDDGKPFACSDCAVTTCTKCHEQYHNGLSCEMYKAGKHEDEEFKEWMQEDSKNRKKCPKCAAPIEKDEGCNHMLCKCGAHICWICLKYFKTASQCYAHLQYCELHNVTD